MLACTTDTDPGDTVAETTTTMTGPTTTGTETTASQSTETTQNEWSTGEPEPAYGVPEVLCEELSPVPVMLGDNPITVTAEPSAVGQTCGGSGAASLYVFTAEAAGDYEIAVTDADFSPVVSLFGLFCDVFDELSCAMPPESLTQSMGAGDVFHIAVDADGGPVEGSATLSITQK